MNRHRVVRLVCCSVILAASIGVGHTALTATAAWEAGDTDTAAPSSTGITVIATQNSPGSTGQLIAFAPNGERMYRTQAATNYFDVDPVSGTRATVEAVTATKLPDSGCSAPSCYTITVERINLSTGTQTTIAEWQSDKAGRTHDVDRLPDGDLLVASMADDAVYIRTPSGRVRWAWHADQQFNISTSGGPYPADWTHLNDVERLPDGRIMASLRNHDQVVFIHPNGTVDEPWTLGADGQHSILYEQHNPDFIPAEDGGPAVVVADSERDRVVEYQRVDGEWQQSWQWQDSQTSWPRDADRLPNGHTLVTDSHGNRVVEVDQRGTVVWSVDVATPYEAERLSTPAESAGGPSARSAGLESRTVASQGGAGGVLSLLPPRILHALQFITPFWMGVTEFALVLLGLGTAVLWVIYELRNSRVTVQPQRPLLIKRR